MPWWGYVLVTLALTHISITAVSVYLHRVQAHHAVTLHPLVSHPLRFWLWLTTGLNTREWVAIHRKHHAKCDTVDDPHSPQVLGLNRLFSETIELYYATLKDAELLPKYGRGTPDDWIERNLYSRHRRLGVRSMLAIDLALFGPLGLTIWAVQRAYPALAAGGMINGVGHYYGYRNYECEDYSTNISPVAVFMGGEELHNNHHAHGAVAKFSHRWFEFDVGSVYLEILSGIGLVSNMKLAPKVTWRAAVPIAALGESTLKAVIAHRHAVVAGFAAATRGVYAEGAAELAASGLAGRIAAKDLRRWIYVADPANLSPGHRAELARVLRRSPKLRLLYRLRGGLGALWARSTASQASLIDQLRAWCGQAEGTDTPALREFSEKLRRYG